MTTNKRIESIFPRQETEMSSLSLFSRLNRQAGQTRVEGRVALSFRSFHAFSRDNKAHRQPSADNKNSLRE